MTHTAHHTVGQRVLRIESEALARMADSLSTEFDAVIDHLRLSQGRIILTGVGKSGHVARKIAATLASTGSPSLYIHPTEASHGDMGMITQGDAVLALSRSGETAELADIIHYCRRFSVTLIAITTNANSTLARAADFLLQLPDAPEACGETRAPTTSTTLQIALGDAVSVALLEAKGFTATDFKNFHPGGALGASLTTIADLMHADMPIVNVEASLEAALKTLGAKGFGCVGIESGGKFIGIITDGDLRRHYADLNTASISDIMTPDPVTATPKDFAANTLRQMTGGTRQISQLFVIENETAVGIVHLHDFLKAGIA